jgi:hypothetical protein
MKKLRARINDSIFNTAQYSSGPYEPLLDSEDEINYKVRPTTNEDLMAIEEQK